MKKLLILILFGLSSSAFSAQLIIDVKDVFDLATYGDVFHRSVELKEEGSTPFSYEIHSWDRFFSTDNHKIKISGYAQKMEPDTYYVKFQKDLYHHDKLVKTLVDNRVVLIKGQKNHLVRDHHWSAIGLVLRQINQLHIK